MLDANDLVMCQSALAKVKEAADLAATKAVEADTWWNRLLGAESTVSAMRTDAVATRNGYEVAAVRLAEMSTPGTTANHADALAFIGSCAAYARVDELLANAQATSMTAALVSTAVSTASDVGTGIKAAATYAAWVVPVVALAVVAGVAWWFFGRRRA